MSYQSYRQSLTRTGLRTALWRLPVGLALVVCLTVLWALALSGVLSVMRGEPLPATWFDILFSTGTPAGTVVFLGLYAGPGLATIYVARTLHARSTRSLVGPAPRTLRHFAVGAGVTLGAAVILTLVARPDVPDVEPNLPASTWALWLPLGLIAVAAQTGSEELLFRGYLQGQLAARLRSPIVWLLLPALLFGGLHYLPNVGPEVALTYVGAATLFGVIAGDLTARTGSIGAAWGIHFANNALAILVVAADPALGGLALYHSAIPLEAGLSDPRRLAVDLAALVGVWILTARLLSR